jgi:hypothetical protein
MTNTNILKSLVQAEMEMQAPNRDKVNTHFNSPYSSLDSLIRSVKTVLLKHGIKMKIDLLESEEKAGAKITLYHISGEMLQGETCWIPVEKEKNMRHAYGKSYTYAQRYAIASFFSLSEAIETDNDGNCDDDKKTTMRVQKKVSEKNKSLCPQTGMHHKHDSLDITNERQRFFGIATNKGLTDKKMKALAFYHFNKLSRSQLTAYEFKHLSDMLERENNASILKMIQKAKVMREDAFASSA